MGARRTYVLVDGENIDATLGNSLLGRRPAPEERPRWERVTHFAEQLWGQQVTGLFFLNASSGSMPTAFVQALLALDYRPIPLAGEGDEKVVDIGVQRTLDALVAHDDADVLLISHDADFAEHVERLVGPRRKVGVIGFREFMSSHLVATGCGVYDLEDDVAAFTMPLPRVRIIPLAEFDPERFLL
ncbi:MAG: NYN domain-containing protein [Nocardioides sp.]|uniref:NYN domain-containing protein n=1 Tax=Nocardioides sp. TaxID=35761 RepID=UPI003F10B27D